MIPNTPPARSAGCTLPHARTLAEAASAGDTLAAALAYRALGVSVFPVETDGQKRPAGAVLPHIPDPEKAGGTKPSWEPYRDRFFTDREAAAWWSDPRRHGIGAVGGPLSGNLAQLDFETWPAFRAWGAGLTADERAILQRCPVVGTPGGGAHVWCRVADAVKGCCYARTAAGETLVEVRGAQHYVVAPGSPAACHPDRRLWRILREGWFDGGGWEPISLDVWYELTLHAAALNEYSRPAAREVVGDRSGADVGDRPGDHFNARVPWGDVLGPAGWRVFRTSGAVTFWTRPGKPSGVSASTGHCRGPSGNDLLYVFSTSAVPFEAGVSYSRFGAYALLNHRGDFRAATRALGLAGYGQPARKGARP